MVRNLILTWIDLGIDLITFEAFCILKFNFRITSAFFRFPSVAFLLPWIPFHNFRFLSFVYLSLGILSVRHYFLFCLPIYFGDNWDTDFAYPSSFPTLINFLFVIFPLLEFQYHCYVRCACNRLNNGHPQTKSSKIWNICYLIRKKA